ncbi:hypothetical protein F8S13_08245 [Chloroflexia bacterium SDU3-3]|nr:hypothetical protein F8S13_08245 [Chloroflexia bacterium SDU3-3]
MSFFVEWVIADPADAAAIAESLDEEQYPPEGWPWLSLQNIGEIDLMLLEAQLRGLPMDAVGDGAELLLQGSEEGPFVWAVSPELVAILASLAPSEHESVAALWQQNEELEPWPVPDLAIVLGEMCDFARQSQSLGRPVLAVGAF